MRLGVVLPLYGGEGRAPAEVYRHAVDDAAFLEDLGYDHVLVGEHHGRANDSCPAPLVMAAAIASRTTRIRVGTCVTLLSLHDPVALTEQAAVVDVISEGRLVLGVGVGYRPDDFAAFGVPRSRRGHRADASLDRLLSLWASDWLAPPPVQRPRPELWVDAGSAPGARRAARVAAAPLFPTLPMPLVRQHVRRHEEACEAVGQPVADRRVLVREVHCAPTRSQAFDECEPTLFRTYRETYLALGGFVAVADDGVSPRVVRDPTDPALESDALVEGRMLVGAPDDVLEGLQAFDAAGFTDVILVAHHRGMDHETARRSLELLGRARS